MSNDFNLIKVDTLTYKDVSSALLKFLNLGFSKAFPLEGRKLSVVQLNNLNFEDSDKLIFIISTSNNSFVGLAEIYKIDFLNRKGMVSLALLDQVSIVSKYSEEILKVMCKIGFDQLGLNKVTFVVSPTDKLMISYLKDSGFQEEVTHKYSPNQNKLISELEYAKFKEINND